MIISETRHFLFVHIIKTAGMSIEQALSPYAERPESVRHLSRHASATDMRTAIGSDVFQRMYKFAFVRNPWDLELSLYHFNLTHPEFPAHAATKKFRDFEHYLMSKKRERMPRGMQLRYIGDEHNNVLVDFVGRYETLRDDFGHVCAAIGIENIQLPHANSTSHKPWQECYTVPMFELVRDIAHMDIVQFGYADRPADYGIGR